MGRRLSGGLKAGGMRSHTPEMDVREAARIMHERDIGALPVVADANRVVGMLTATDVMQYIVSGPAARGRTRQVQRRRSR